MVKNSQVGFSFERFMREQSEHPYYEPTFDGGRRPSHGDGSENFGSLGVSGGSNFICLSSMGLQTLMVSVGALLSPYPPLAGIEGTILPSIQFSHFCFSPCPVASVPEEIAMGQFIFWQLIRFY